MLMNNDTFEMKKPGPKPNQEREIIYNSAWIQRLFYRIWLQKKMASNKLDPYNWWLVFWGYIFGNELQVFEEGKPLCHHPQI